MENEKIEELKERLKGLQEKEQEFKSKQHYYEQYLADLKQEKDETKDIWKKDEMQQKIDEETAKKELEEENSKKTEAQIEEVYTSIRTEMEQSQKAIETKEQQIAKLTEKNKQLLADSIHLTEEILENEEVMKLKLGKPSSKVYTSAKQENERLLKSKRGKLSAFKKNENKMKKLTTEIENLGSYYEALSLLLPEKQEAIEEEQATEKITTENEKQEDLGMNDEYWEEYRTENESAEAKAIEGGKEDYEEHRKQQAKLEQEESEEDYEASRTAEDEIAWYDAELGDKKDNPEMFIARVGEERKEEQPKPESHLQNGTKLPQKPNTKPQYKILNAGLEIEQLEEGESTPIYYVLLEKENGETFRFKRYASNYIQEVTPELQQKLEDKLITESKKYYDVGLASILKEVDEQFGTNGFTKYKELIHNKFLKNKHESEINIDYDFSNQYGKILPEEQVQMKLIKKIAKANAKLGLAKYEKAPNVFKRMWKNLMDLFKVKEALPEGQEEQIVEPQEQATQSEDVQNETPTLLDLQLMNNAEKRSIIDDMIKLSDYEEYNSTVALNQIAEVANEKTLVQDEQNTKLQEMSLRDKIALGKEIQQKQKEAAEKARKAYEEAQRKGEEKDKEQQVELHDSEGKEMDD